MIKRYKIKVKNIFTFISYYILLIANIKLIHHIINNINGNYNNIRFLNIVLMFLTSSIIFMFVDNIKDIKVVIKKDIK